RLVHDFDMTDIMEQHWPREFQVESSPIESFRRSVRASTRMLETRKGWRDVRPIFLIDEFTYVYEYIREGLRTPAFMRQWKSLLESRTFDAVLVGQDTMPRFKEAYPNEFGVTHDERISYLSQEEARALAEDPIMMGSESRYKGASLDRLTGLTAGSAAHHDGVLGECACLLLTEVADPLVVGDAELVRVRLLETGHGVLADQHGIERPAFEKRLPLPHEGRREQSLTYVFVHVGEFVDEENGPDIAPALAGLQHARRGTHAAPEALNGRGFNLKFPRPVLFHDIRHIKVMHEPFVQRVDTSLHKAALRLGRVNGAQAEVDGQVRRVEPFSQLPEYRRLTGSFLPVEHEALAERPAGDLAVDTLEEFSPPEEHLLLLDRSTARIPAVRVGDAHEPAGGLERGHHGPGRTLCELAGGAPEAEAQGHRDLAHAKRQVRDLEPLDK